MDGNSRLSGQCLPYAASIQAHCYGIEDLTRPVFGYLHTFFKRYNVNQQPAWFLSPRLCGPLYAHWFNSGQRENCEINAAGTWAIDFKSVSWSLTTSLRLNIVYLSNSENPTAVFFSTCFSSYSQCVFTWFKTHPINYSRVLFPTFNLFPGSAKPVMAPRGFWSATLSTPLLIRCCLS